jgi:hypothetical protein
LFFGAALIVAAVLLSAGVYAYSPNFRGIANDVIDFYVSFFEPILNALFGQFGGTGMYLFERLLLMILFIALVFLSLGRVPLFEDQKKMRWIVTIVVALMGIRFIRAEWINSIFTQYAAVAIIITAVFPFVLYFFFVYSFDTSYYFRKALWLFFIVIYIGIWFTTESAMHWLFFWTAVCALICFFADEKIALHLRMRKLREGANSAAYEAIADLERRIKSIESSSLPDKIKEKEIKKLRDRINDWYKALA